MKGRIQESESRSQNNKAETTFSRFSFLLAPEFWILNSAFPGEQK